MAFSIVIFSSLITLLVTVVQLLQEYRVGVDAVRGQISQLEALSLPAVSENLWNLYHRQLQGQLEDLIHAPDLQYLEVRSRGELVASTGAFSSEDGITVTLPLTRTLRGETIPIGELLVVASLEGVHQKLYNRALVILVSNAFKTALVSIFIFFIFQFLVTRHLLTICRHLGSLSASGLDKTLTLNRRASDDELEQVVSAINEMGRTLGDTTVSRDYVDNIVASMGDALVVTSPDSKIRLVNERTRALLGYEEHELVGRSVGELFEHEQGVVLRKDFVRMMSDENTQSMEMECLSKGRDRLAVQVSSSTMRGAMDEIQGIVYVIRDVTERKKAEARLETLARLDSLTGLANRTAFRAHLEENIQHCDRTGTGLAILLIDLDDFKDVNDTLGHPAGDALLREVALRLKGVVRETDSVARLGGDEFVVVMTYVRYPSDAANVADKIVEELRRAVKLESHEIYITVSTGIALYPLDGRGPDQLLKHADLALYAAKNEGRDRFKFFDEQMNTQVQIRKSAEAAMRTALTDGSFFLQFQPELDINSGRVIGVEALARWRHPQRGLVPPEEFIPIAEATGLIVPLGEKLLRMACEQGVQWQRAGLPPIRMAVNLSAIQLRRSGFVETLTRVLRETGMDASQLELEITERIIMDKTMVTANELERLRLLGVGLAIDDFGTGYSSLAYLKRFSVDSLKIDRSFVRDLDAAPGDAAICQTIIKLGTSLDLNVIAEGVETKAQAEFLRRHGCQQVQGNYFCEPLAANEFEAYWRREQGPALWEARAAG